MRHLSTLPRVLLGLALPLAFFVAQAHGEPPQVTFSQQPGAIQIRSGGEPVATYVYDDPEIPRQYIRDVHAPNGTQVTRNHPPVAGKDLTDHALLHPGIWMAFGNLAGADNWRNRDRVLYDGFVEKPFGGPGRGTFVVCNLYLKGNDRTKILCREVCRLTFLVRPAGYLLLWDSTFRPVAENVSFGDQEEMGLGVRVASPIMAQRGGRILNSNGQIDEKQAWGKAADWCDYSGRIEDQWVGITLMCDPANFRPSWFHARDYGLLLANPFGRKAFHKGNESRVVVTRDKPLRLRFALLMHSAAQQEQPNMTEAYVDFLELLAERDDTQTDD